jgi:acyl-CoA thioesterase-1
MDKKDGFKFRSFSPKYGVIILVTALIISIVFGCSRKEPATLTQEKANIKEKQYDGTIAAVGDSLTAGMGVKIDHSYPALLEAKLHANGYRFKVVNAGVSGETSSGALSRIDWVVASLKPQIVILETGANDGMRGIPLNVLRENLDKLVSRLKQNKIVVILAGMQMFPNLGPKYTRGFQRIYPEIAQKHQVILIPFFLKDVAAVAHLNQADKMHPNPEGYAVIVETIYPYVEEALQAHSKTRASS